MGDYILSLMMVAFIISLYDKKAISALQRQGKYDPYTHETLMKRVFRGVFIFLPKKPKAQAHSELTPPGDLSSYNYDSTVCLDAKGKKTRLSYPANLVLVPYALGTAQASDPEEGTKKCTGERTCSRSRVF